MIGDENNGKKKIREWVERLERRKKIKNEEGRKKFKNFVTLTEDNVNKNLNFQETRQIILSFEIVSISIMSFTLKLLFHKIFV